jgi:hypothetical protein
MSSSSSHSAVETPEETPGTDSAWLARLLGAMAKEWTSLGDEIMGVGDALSTRALTKGGLQGVKEMQSFDALSQLARAQAVLLDSISAQLHVPATQMRLVLEARIAELPISTVSQRMLRAVNSEIAPEAPAPIADEEQDTVLWFG